jgi:hypothetical protein
MIIKIKQTDLDVLTTMRSQAKSGIIKYWQIYEWLGNKLVDDYGVSITDSAVLWLRGATEAYALSENNAIGTGILKGINSIESVNDSNWSIIA